MVWMGSLTLLLPLLLVPLLAGRLVRCCRRSWIESRRDVGFVVEDGVGVVVSGRSNDDDDDCGYNVRVVRMAGLARRMGPFYLCLFSCGLMM